mmetsp:Transcript_35104/g.83848  ORF Transcript_35104/g.83848 Transcript_35104/m.83848 type:complete len:254 (-) Transcript_35104:173-934(-)
MDGRRGGRGARDMERRSVHVRLPPPLRGPRRVQVLPHRPPLSQRPRLRRPPGRAHLVGQPAPLPPQALRRSRRPALGAPRREREGVLLLRAARGREGGVRPEAQRHVRAEGARHVLLRGVPGRDGPGVPSPRTRRPLRIVHVHLALPDGDPVVQPHEPPCRTAPRTCLPGVQREGGRARGGDDERDREVHLPGIRAARLHLSRVRGGDERERSRRPSREVDAGQEGALRCVLPDLRLAAREGWSGLGRQDCPS